MTPMQRAHKILDIENGDFGVEGNIDPAPLILDSIAAEIKAIEDAAYRRGVEEEREACAKIAEPNHKCDRPGCCDECKEAYQIADLIRSRTADKREDGQ